MSMPTRRTFILTGLAGSAVLVGTYWLRGPIARPGTAAARAAETATILRAMIPVLLDGALPASPAQHEAALQTTVANVQAAIAGLPPAAQRELGELFTFLGWAPTRVAFAGLTRGWDNASREEVTAVLERWRTSRFDMQRTAYDALHQLVLGAWYATPDSWVRIGYPGPPELPA